MPASSVAHFVIIAALAAAPALGAAQAQSNQLAANTTNQTTAATSQPATSQPSVAPKICKRIESSYSRMAKRVCLTKEEWQRVEAVAQ
jgi:predicted transglutaminase-like cysteine proteinase